MKRPVQYYFTREYLERCAKYTPEEIIEFLENYRLLFGRPPSTGVEELDIKDESSVRRNDPSSPL